MERIDEEIEKLKNQIKEDQTEFRELDMRIRRYEVEMAGLRTLITSIKNRLDIFTKNRAEKRTDMRNQTNEILSRTDRLIVWCVFSWMLVCRPAACSYAGLRPTRITDNNMRISERIGPRWRTPLCIKKRLTNKR